MSNWTVCKKIYLGFGSLLILLAAIVIGSFTSTGRLSFLAGISQRATEGNLFMIERQVDHLAWIHSLNESLLTGSEFKGQLDPTKCKFGLWLYDDQIQRNIADAELKNLLLRIREPHARLHQSAKAITEAERNSSPDEARRVYASVTLPSLNETSGLLKEVRQRYDGIRNEEGGKAAADLGQTASDTRLSMLLLGALAMLVGGVVAFALNRSVSKSLKRVILAVGESAAQISAAAGQVSTSGQSLAQGASEQAATIEETSAAAEQVTAVTRRNSANSRTAAGVVATTDSALNSTEHAVEQLLATVAQIATSSGNIAKIIKVIDEISFQTNILALNAAVEAARAGEAGLGFAVVADEVRTLAQRCAAAARDTTSLIEQSIASSSEGEAKVNVVVNSIRQVIAQSANLRTLMEEVSAGSQEQAIGIEEIMKAISNVEGITQTTAATAEETAAAAEELNGQSETLNAEVELLTRMVGR